MFQHFGLFCWKAVRSNMACGLSRAALDVAPANAIQQGEAGDIVPATLTRRLRAHLPGLG